MVMTATAVTAAAMSLYAYCAACPPSDSNGIGDLIPDEETLAWSQEKRNANVRDSVYEEAGDTDTDDADEEVDSDRVRPSCTCPRLEHVQLPQPLLSSSSAPCFDKQTPIALKPRCQQRQQTKPSLSPTTSPDWGWYVSTTPEDELDL